ncbi:MAG: TonB-dependent receptor domain-containing protein [Paludibacteraceae bacterium]
MNNLQIGSGYNQLDLMQKILYKPTTRFSHLLNLQYSTSSNIPRYDRLTEISGNNPMFAEWYYGHQKRLMAAYNFSGNQFFGADKTGFTIAFHDMEEGRHSRKLNKSNLKNQTENVKAFTLSSFWGKSTKNQLITVGLDGALNFLKSTALNLNIGTLEKTPVDTRYPGGNNHMHHLDIYTNYINDLSEKIQFSTGFRFGYSALFAEFTDKTFFLFPQNNIIQNNLTYSGSAGINYRPDEFWKFALDVSTGFRVPNMDDLAKIFDSQPGKLIVPNPGIQLEKTLGV